jgi:ATP/maltotriose-dependent transcriptional regulator MalT
LDRGEWWVVQGWLEMIPEPIRKSNEDLLLTELRIFEDTWKLEDISSILSSLESQGIENADSKTRASYLFHKGHYFTFARSDARKAMECLEQSKKLYENESSFGARRELILATARQMLGQSSLALKSLEEIERKYEPSSIMHIRSLHSRVFVYILSGNIKEALKDAERFHFIARNCEHKTVEAFSWYLHGNIALQSFNEDIAVQSFNGVRCFQGMSNYRMYFDAMAGLILFHSLKGNERDIELFLQEMSEMASKFKDRRFQIYYRSIRARVSLHRGQGEKELAWAQTDWTKQSPASYFFLIDVPDLTKIRIIVSHGTDLQAAEALCILAEVEAFLDSIHNKYHSIDIELLKTMALLRIDRKELAKESLKKALLSAEKEDRIMPVMEAYRVMPSLIDLVGQDRSSRRLLSRIGIKSSNNGLVPVSYSKSDEISLREKQVIRLIAAGLQNKEVADKLNISTVTVKSHLTNVYRKLEVPNRITMLRVARDRRILK